MKPDHNPLVTVVDGAPRAARRARGRAVRGASRHGDPTGGTHAPAVMAVPEQSDAPAKLHELRTGARDRL